MVPRSEPAAKKPQLALRESLTRRYRPTERVWSSGAVRMMLATRNSLRVPMKASSTTTARTGADSGRIMVKKTRACPAPSIFIASSSSLGTVSKNPLSRNVLTPSAPPM